MLNEAERDSLDSIAYQLKRIADALEEQNERNCPKTFSSENELEIRRAEIERRFKNGQVNEND